MASPAPHFESPLTSETTMLLLTMQFFRQYKNPVLYMWKGDAFDGNEIYYGGVLNDGPGRKIIKLIL